MHNVLCVSAPRAQPCLEQCSTSAEPVPPKLWHSNFQFGLEKRGKTQHRQILTSNSSTPCTTVGQQKSALILGRILNIFILDEIYQRATSFSSSSSSPFSSIFFLIAAFASDNLSFFLWVTWPRWGDQPIDNQDVTSVFV